MNLQQFAALKAGDKVCNNMFGERPPGVVTETNSTGVRVSWGGTATTFEYSVQSTAWFHWSLADEQ